MKTNTKTTMKTKNKDERQRLKTKDEDDRPDEDEPSLSPSFLPTSSYCLPLTLSSFSFAPSFFHPFHSPFCASHSSLSLFSAFPPFPSFPSLLSPRLPCFYLEKQSCSSCFTDLFSDQVWPTAVGIVCPTAVGKLSDGCPVAVGQLLDGRPMGI